MEQVIDAEAEVEQMPRRDDSAVAKSGTDPATRPESYRQTSAAHAPSGLLNVY